MEKMDDKKRVLAAESEWRKTVLDPHETKNAKTYEGKSFTTISDMEVPLVAGPSHLEGIDPLTDIGFPGQYPFKIGRAHV